MLLSSNIVIANSFTLNQKAINPACVWLLLNTHGYAGYTDTGSNVALSYFKSKKQNIISSINLNACQNSHTAGKVSIVTMNRHQAPLVRYQFPWGINNDFNQALAKGMFGYQYIGRSQNGIDVLKVISSGGGSGVFSGIALLRLQPYTLISAGPDDMSWQRQHYNQLRLVAYIAGGDRASGGLKSMQIEGDTLKVIRYNPKNQPNKPTLPNEHLHYNLKELSSYSTN